MSRGLVYAILGRGSWAGKIHTILTAENRDVVNLVESRQAANEGPSEYRARLAEQIRAKGAQAVWLCVPPGPHVSVMIESALDAGRAHYRGEALVRLAANHSIADRAIQISGPNSRSSL